MPRGRVIRKAGGEVVSSRILSARLVGRVSGIAMNLAECLVSLATVADRCAYALGDGLPLLDKSTQELIAEIRANADNCRKIIARARQSAEAADQSVRAAK